MFLSIGQGNLSLCLGTFPAAYDFALPETAIAQSPSPERDAARLLVLDRAAHAGVRAHARVRALSGERARALQALEEIKRDPGVRYLVPTLVAETYGVLGDLDQAFEWLEVAFEEKDPFLFSVLLADPHAEAIRADARYQDLLRRTGYPGAQ